MDSSRGKQILFLATAAALLSPFSYASGQITSAQAASSGPGHPWQGGAHEVNLYSLARETTLPIVAWASRGDLEIDFGLHHCSQGVGSDATLSPKWTHSYDARVDAWTDSGGVQRAALVLGDHTAHLFKKVGGAWIEDDGYRDHLSATATGFLVKRRSREQWTFEPTATTGRYRLASITDRSGNAIALEYDGVGNLVRVKDPTQRWVGLEYATVGGVTKLVRVTFEGQSLRGSFNRAWTLAYDVQGRLKTVTEPDARTTTFGYTSDGRNNVASMIDRAGATTTFGYTLDDASWEQLPAHSSSERSYSSKPTSSTRLLTDELGITATATFDSSTRLVSLADAAGVATTLSYADVDYAFAPSQVLLSTGSLWQFDFDGRGDILRTTDAAGQHHDYVYDALDRLVRSEEPLCTDAWGVVEPQRHRTEYVYDTLDRLIRVDRLSPSVTLSTSYQYDSNGNRNVATDPAGNSTQYVWDYYGNLASITTPTGRTVRRIFRMPEPTYNYTRPRRAVDGNGDAITYSYDAVGRRIYSRKDGGQPLLYQYDAMDRLVRITDQSQSDPADQVLQFQWRLDGTLLNEIHSGGTVYHGVLANGDPLCVQVNPNTPGMREYRYVYDSLGRLKTIVDRSESTKITRDASGRVTSRIAPSGARVDYVYDALDRVVSKQVFDAANQLLSSYDMSFQENGLLKQQVELGPYGYITTRYGYDLFNRLVREEKTGGLSYDATWTYDAAGNRIRQVENGVTTTYAYDADDLLLTAVDSSGTQTFTWNANGQLTQRARSTLTQRFNYDERGQLAQLDDTHLSPSTFTKVAGYRYDGLGRLSGSLEYDNYGNLNSTSRRIFDRDDVVREELYTASGYLVGERENLFEGGLLTTRDLTGGTTYYPATDGLGSVKDLADSYGYLHPTYAVSNAFGNPIASSAYDLETGFAADCGAREDLDAGLLWTGATFALPDVGVVLSSGPFGDVFAQEDGKQDKKGGWFLMHGPCGFYGWVWLDDREGGRGRDESVWDYGRRLWHAAYSWEDRLKDLRDRLKKYKDWLDEMNNRHGLSKSLYLISVYEREIKDLESKIADAEKELSEAQKRLDELRGAGCKDW